MRLGARKVRRSLQGGEITRGRDTGHALCFAGATSRPSHHRTVDLLGVRAGIPSPLQAVRISAAFAWLGRFEEGRVHMAALVDRARAAGAIGSLPYLLAGCAWQALHASRWNEAEADAAEAHALADELAQPVTASALGSRLHALRGTRLAPRVR
jgi:hypothetical protein